MPREDLFPRIVYGLEAFVTEDMPASSVPEQNPSILIYAENETGIRNLYRLVTGSRMDARNGRMEISRSLLKAHREGLLIGAVCESGELSEIICRGGTAEELKAAAAFYDFIELTPYCTYTSFEVSEKGIYRTDQDKKNLLCQLYRVGKDLGLPEKRSVMLKTIWKKVQKGFWIG